VDKPASRIGVFWRVSFTVVAVIVVQTIVCGLAALPVLLLWLELLRDLPENDVLRAAVLSASIVPSYALFAAALMIFTPAATALTGARTPQNAELRITEMSWPLMRWARYMVAIHMVRILAGPIFRASPIFTFYLRLNGARLGQRVYVNTLFISDHNMLEFGDDVVIGSEVHLSGHTVERGFVKTGTVRFAKNVTIGLGAVIDIDVEAGEGCTVGAMSLVPKHTKLEAGAVYAGIPVKRIG
jgi:acetyltransferase-like isoleucine patch superfamily enzyme